MIIRLIVGQVRKIVHNQYLKMSQYFPKLNDRFGGNVKVELDFYNQATKVDLKKVTRFDTSNLAAKSDLASLKAEVDKIDLEKLKIFPVDLSKFSNVVNNEVVNKSCV